MITEALMIRRIDCRCADAVGRIEEIRRQLSPQGDVVSARGRRLTIEAFGEPLSPRQVVERICRDVAERGLDAVLEYGQKLDAVELTPATVRVAPAELDAAHRNASEEYLGAIRRVKRNIMEFQSGILHRDAVMGSGDHELRLLYKPLRRVGICIPGGAAAYPSTLLMTAVPAQAAGVERIAVVAPPTPFGSYNPDLLAACREIGVEEVYRIGGAQGVAALAYGIEGLEPVDMIAGPGNLFVALAKQRVASIVGIDMLAGPTEVVVLADESANPHFVAADLIAQAEHSPGASILITWAEGLADEVAQSIEVQLETLERRELARESLEMYGALIEASDEEEACRLSNRIAPEHLQIETSHPERTLEKIHSAGTVFLGHYTPVAVGDYVAGPSHTLPTGGTARFASGLSSNDFLRPMSVIRYSPAKLRAVSHDVAVLANTERLTGHRHSVDVRLDQELLARIERSIVSRFDADDPPADDG